MACPRSLSSPSSSNMCMKIPAVTRASPSAVWRPTPAPEAFGDRIQMMIGCMAEGTPTAAGYRHRVVEDDTAFRLFHLDKLQVKGGIVRDQHGVADELAKLGQHQMRGRRRAPCRPVMPWKRMEFLEMGRPGSTRRSKVSPVRMRPLTIRTPAMETISSPAEGLSQWFPDRTPRSRATERSFGQIAAGSSPRAAG